jgi:hypothetical protein
LLSIKENPYIVGFDIYFEYFSKIEKPKFRGFYRVISYNKSSVQGIPRHPFEMKLEN